MQDGAGLPGALSEAELAKQRTLKAIVIGLGILILLAFAGVVVGMAYRASQIGKGSPAKGGAPGITGPAAPSAASRLALQPELKLSLPQASTVRSATLQGTLLVVHHDGPGGAGIVILDLATGQIVSRLRIEVGP